MRFDILTIFPNIFTSYFQESILRIAQEKHKIDLHIHDIRAYTKNKHKKTDDIPYGGGPGMVMMVQPIYDCLLAIPRLDRSRVIMFDPGGTEYTQIQAKHYSESYDQIILLCGRYEGFDERVYKLVDERISIGKYVLSGGEIPAMVVTESITRLLPGVLGHIESTHDETFSGSLDYIESPQYTRPETFTTNTGENWVVPPILLSGNHAEIEKWRKENPKTPT
ncbi:MAG: tRNA (guanosine(37)-N1)-methyltransferase TrmD [Patescibacteria group bacterium]|jgi:tRNA (guanine37-N1)-methyltransferase